jgi:hypothetical protein
MLTTNKRSRSVQRASAFLGIGLAACAHPEHVEVPVESAAPPKIIEAVSRPVEKQPTEREVATPPPKTWLSRDEVEASHEVERQHAWDMQTFWTMRKDRESLRPTNIGPGGACVCVGGDPLCACR